MTRYVVDASTAVKLYLPEPHAAEAQGLFALLAPTPAAAEFHVPDLFHVECGNIFWKQTQRRNVTPAQAVAFAAALRLLPLRSTPTFDLMPAALDIALSHGVTAYDACYVALADRLGASLVTADRQLEQRLFGTRFAPVWLGRWVPPP